jgi:hypothetical protein
MANQISSRFGLQHCEAHRSLAVLFVWTAVKSLFPIAVITPTVAAQTAESK